MAKQGYEFKNLTKAQQDCLSLIESLGIYELRALARVFGDNSPTTLKRNDHIKIVMDKIISGEELKPLPLRQGRPYKELSNIEGILAELSQITGKDYSLKSSQALTANRAQKAVTFKQIEENVLKQKLFPIEAMGILCERNDKEFFFHNQTNEKFILVKKDIDSRLKPFDYVVGTAVAMNENGDHILDSVKYINFQNQATYQDKTDEYKDCLPSQQLNFEGNEILLGSRYILKEGKLTENAIKLKKLLKTLNENKIVTIALLANVMYEDKAEINSLGFNSVFALGYDEKPTIICETLSNVVENIKRLQNQGLRVALFVQDITTMANGVDFAYRANAKSLMGHTENAVELVKSLMLLAKSGGKDKHTTVFVTMDDADLFDQMYVSAVYKVSKKFSL